MTELVAMEERHLPMVLEWRNHPDVRKYMYTQHEIDVAEHAAWFERAHCDLARRLFVCYEEGAPVGVVAFTEIDAEHKRASWAFYSGDLGRPGLGSRMELAAINYAFTELALDKLWCEVLSTNPKVVTLHRKFGFLVEGVYSRHYVRDGVPVDVVRLALFRDSWERYLRASMESVVARRAPADPLAPGTSHEERVVLTKEMVAQFAHLSGDDNPIHRDAAAARAVGFPAPVAHGMLLGAVLSGVFGTRFPGPGTVYLKQSLAFVAPALVGEEVVIRVRVLSRIGRMVVVAVEIARAGGEVVATGEAELLAPRPGGAA